MAVTWPCNSSVFVSTDLSRVKRREACIHRCSSSAFVSTNLGYKLRNLGIEQLVVTGGLTDQCIDSAVRDACDLGFLVTVATDACVTHSAERHDSALRNNRGYCRQVPTSAIVTAR